MNASPHPSLSPLLEPARYAIAPASAWSTLHVGELEPRLLFSGVAIESLGLDGDDLSLIDDSDLSIVDDVVEDVGVVVVDVIDSLLALLGDSTVHSSTSSVAMADDGSYILVWSRNNQDGNGWDIYAQRFDDTGVALGEAFQVNQSSQREQLQAAVAVDAQGHFLITWTSDQQDGDKLGVYGRMYGANGAAMTNELLINTTTTGNQYNSSVAACANGEFIVVWQGTGAGGEDGIYGQRLGADGTRVGAEFLVAAADTSQLTSLAVSANSAGHFVVAWVENGSAEMQVFDWDLHRLGQVLEVGQHAAANTIDVWIGEQGQVVATWNETISGETRAFYQIFDQDQMPLAGKTTVTSPAVPQAQWLPTVSGDAAGNFAIAWEGHGPDSEFGVFVKRFEADGQPLQWTLLVAAASGEGVQPVLSMRNLDDFVIAWIDPLDETLVQPVHRLYVTDYQATAAGVSAPIVIDGQRDDDWALAEQHRLRHLVEGQNVGGEFRAVFSSLWDADHLYLSLTFTDSEWDHVHEEALKSERLFEVLIDGNASRDPAMEGSSDLRLAFRPSDQTVWSISPDGAMTQVNVAAAVRDHSGGYFVEMAVPWSLIGVVPQSGSQVGLDWLVHRLDAVPAPTASLAWGATVAPASPQPALWGTLNLSPLPGPSTGTEGSNDPPPDGQEPAASDEIGEPTAPSLADPSEPVSSESPVVEDGAEPLPVSEPDQDTTDFHPSEPTEDAVALELERTQSSTTTDSTRPLVLDPVTTTSTSTTTSTATSPTTSESTRIASSDSTMTPSESGPVESRTAQSEDVDRAGDDTVREPNGGVPPTPHESRPGAKEDKRREDEMGAWVPPLDGDGEMRTNADGELRRLVSSGPSSLSALSHLGIKPQISAASNLFRGAGAIPLHARLMVPGLPSFSVLVEQVADEVQAIRAQITIPTGAIVAASVTSAVTVGYLAWALRGGMFLAGMVTAIPAWQSFDPLPVLQHQGAVRDDGESLESIASGARGTET